MNAPRQPLLSFDAALAALLAQVTPLSRTEQISTFDADRRVLAEDLISPLHVPPHDNAAMDGYAVRSADMAHSGTVLRVTQRIPAGQFGQPLAAGEAARIFTGAAVPAGADAVVMQEDTQALEPTMSGTLPDAMAGGIADGMAQDRPTTLPRVQINTVPTPGLWLRRAGEDVRQGSVVLRHGARLNPASLGLAASLGRSQLVVAARPRVALFSTGDELVMPGTVAPQDLRPGAIYNSNRYVLRALLHRLGCTVSDLGIVPDQRAATITALKNAADQHDLILTSGGVSVGEEDHIKPAVQQLGHLDLWQIGMKPGKPLAHGWVQQGAGAGQGAGAACHFIGLPGNPVSSLVTFLLLVRPFLLKLQGATALDVAVQTLPAHFSQSRADQRREFLRARRNHAGGLDLFANQSAGVLTSAVWGDGLIDNPAGHAIAHGELVRFLPFAELLA
jgi:molybdopterin molybdotransferase